MVHPDSVHAYAKAQPFRPFRLHMASGTTFDVRHPENVRVGRTDLIVFTTTSRNPEIYATFQTVSLMLVESISHLDAATAAS